MKMTVVSLDSFDLPRAGCTTHVASLLMIHLHKKGFEVQDFPRLVRLNPSVPWKTRGNASIAFEVNGEPQEVFEESKHFLRDFMQRVRRGAIAVSEGWLSRDFYLKAVERVVDPRDVKLIVQEKGVLWEGSERALVGALASMSTTLSDVPNFEMLAYRDPDASGRRKCYFHPLFEMLHDHLYPLVHESSGPIICPRGDDPVLYGIRGRNTAAIVSLAKLIVGERPSMAVIFRTNQHSYDPRELEEMYTYDFGKKRVKITEEEIVEIGEDVKLNDYMLFKETGLTKLLRRFMRYNRILLDMEINVINKPNVKSISKMKITRGILVNERAPRCPRCGAPMVSMGRRTLTRRCKRCGYRAMALRKLEIVDMSEVELFPVEGRKLHLEGPYRGTIEKMRRFLCKRLEPGCAVAYGFAHHGL
ncbi:tRNA(Ile2) 2-agmatinylcytidine synthetase [Ignicoccus pacificus DSM 13166]|uniref:tRNA(Ile2) 2-agmatinylcytidine synthetase n=1 Tax=Ignicoccus pacificus DSM 13166 TaxID=940294 RepID=A0A977PJN6_9CREN|nr:tRNA(Ile2) 2-agmatinylcytidine synthetase [Ignicoccus pacificus DSM 13166]